MAINMGEAVGYLDLDITQYQAGFQSALKQLKQFQSQSTSTLSKVGTNLSKVGTSLTSKLTKPALAATSALAGITLAKGWSRMTAIDTAKGKLTALSDAAVKAGKDAYDVGAIMDDALAAVKGTAYGLDEAATAAASAVAAGIKPGKDLQRYLTSVGDAAAVSGRSMTEMGSIYGKIATSGRAQMMELNQIADSGISIYQALVEQLGISQSEVRDWASAGKISAEDFYAAMERAVGGSAKIIGSTTIKGAIANLGASIGRIGANFLGASDDADSFAGHMLPLLNQLTDYLGGIEEKAKAWGNTFAGAFEKAVDIFIAMPNQLKVALGAFTIGIGPATKLTGTIMKSMSALKVFNTASQGTSVAMGVLRGDLSLSTALLGKFGNSAVSAGKTASNALQSAFTNLPSYLSQQIQAYRTQSARLQTVNTLYGANARGIYAASTATMGNTLALRANQIANSGVVASLKSAISSTLAFAAAHRTAMIAALGLAGPIIALAGYMLSTGTSADEMAQKITDFSINAANAINQFSAQIPSIMAGLTANITVAVGAIANQMPQIVSNLTYAVVSVIESLSGQIPTLIPLLTQAAVTLFMGLVYAAQQVIQPLVAAIPPLINALVSAIVVLAPAILQAGITLLMALVKAIPQIIPPLVAAIPQIINAIVSQIPGMVPTLVNGAIQLFMGFVQAIPQIIPALVAAIPQIITAIVRGIGSFAGTMVTTGAQVLQNLWKGISSWVGTLRGNVVSAVKSLPKKIQSGLGTLFSIGVSFIKTLWNGFSSWVGTLGGKVIAAVKKIPGKIRSGLGSLFSVGADFIQGLWNGISGKIGGVIEMAKEKIKGLPGAVKKVLGIGSPSYIMHEYGEFFMQGLQNGLDKGFRPVLSSAQANMKDLLNTFKPLNGYDFGIKESPEIRITKSLEALSTTNASGSAAAGGVDIVNNITVDGADNPMDFMQTFTRQLKMDMRTI